MRVVLDANVYASALINPSGSPGLLLARLFRDRALQIVASREILQELRRALRYTHVKRRTRMSDAEIDEFVALIAQSAILTADRAIGALTRDPDDDKYVAVALEGLADFIVTGDQDLLQLRQHEGIRILSPRDFLNLLDA